jgi:hypothetical protein
VTSGGAPAASIAETIAHKGDTTTGSIKEMTSRATRIRRLQAGAAENQLTGNTKEAGAKVQGRLPELTLSAPHRDAAGSASRPPELDVLLAVALACPPASALPAQSALEAAQARTRASLARYPAQRRHVGCRLRPCRAMRGCLAC